MVEMPVNHHGRQFRADYLTVKSFIHQNHHILHTQNNRRVLCLVGLRECDSQRSEMQSNPSDGNGILIRSASHTSGNAAKSPRETEQGLIS
jgi:hypothetical protein